MNNNIFDNSQVSFMTADLDIHDMDIFKNEISRRYNNSNNILGELNVLSPQPGSQPKLKEDNEQVSVHSQPAHN